MQGRVGLRIEVQHQRLVPRHRQRGRQVHGRRRLADATLLIQYRDPSHPGSLPVSGHHGIYSPCNPGIGKRWPVCTVSDASIRPPSDSGRKCNRSAKMRKDEIAGEDSVHLDRFSLMPSPIAIDSAFTTQSWLRSVLGMVHRF